MRMVAGGDRRAIILGVGVVGIALLALRVVPAARRLVVEERRETIAVARQWVTVKQLVSGRKTLADSLQRLNRTWDEKQAHLFDARTTNGLTAQIASYITRAVRGASVELASLQVRPDTIAVGGFRRVTVSATARGDITGMMALISALEHGPRLFRIASLTVNQSDVVGHPNVAESLGLEMTLQTLAIDRDR